MSDEDSRSHDDQDIRSLGHDVVWCADPNATDPSLAGRTRFLDHLWLPSALAELSKEQILVINRYRESVIESDGQYAFAQRARQMLVQAVIDIRPTAIVEIGCGKFPIDAPCERYLGIDIDAEAISFIRRQGKAGCKPAELAAKAVAPIDCVVSAYAMHFSVSDRFLRDLDAVASRDAVFCFNIIAESSLSALCIVAKLSSNWPLLQVIKTARMARREFFFVAGRASAAKRVISAAHAIKSNSASPLLTNRDRFDQIDL